MGTVYWQAAGRFARRRVFGWYLEVGRSFVWRREGLFGGALAARYVRVRVGPWYVGAFRSAKGL